MKEGIIKFNCDWKKANPLDLKKLISLNEWRGNLYSQGLIGEKRGIGFGNISIREKGLKFITTGSGTGKFPELDEKHYTLVTKFDIIANLLECKGPIKASSESMTHAAVYISDESVNAVIHVHSLKLWKKLVGNIPTTSRDAEYGTPEMAKEVIRLFEETDVRKRRIFAMEGHREGIVTFGRTLDEAGIVLLDYFDTE